MLIIQELLNAVLFLHSLGFVHGDLKPENILLCVGKDNSVSVKLIDFGLMFDYNENNPVGTPFFISPYFYDYGTGVNLNLMSMMTNRNLEISDLEKKTDGVFYKDLSEQWKKFHADYFSLAVIIKELEKPQLSNQLLDFKEVNPLEKLIVTINSKTAGGKNIWNKKTGIAIGIATVLLSSFF